MKRIILAAVAASALAVPALADEVGVRVGPVDATVGADRTQEGLKRPRP